jgi:hypothetical protein
MMFLYVMARCSKVYATLKKMYDPPEAFMPAAVLTIWKPVEIV